MQTGLQAEVLFCPNCREEVPKTLYCLNCGYPLYKIESDQIDTETPIEEVEEEITVEIVPEPVIVNPVADEVTIIVDDDEDETEEAPPAVEEVVEEIEATEEEPLVDAIVEESVPIPTMEDAIVVSENNVTSIVEIVENEIQETPIVEVVEEPVPEESVLETVEITETVEIALEEPEEEPESVVLEVMETFEEEQPFEPEPIIMEVMTNFAKNISMKIRLVNLLKEDGVKTEIFAKLYDSYVARGELLMNSRTEMLERVRYDLGSMERALNEAKEGLEELEIRKTINDISGEEYAAKAPGYEWDIAQYKDEVVKKKAEIKYLDDITKMFSEDEVNELVELGDSCYSSLDELVDEEKITTETAIRVKVTLEESLSCLRSSY